MPAPADEDERDLLVSTPAMRILLVAASKIA
jgi:hypothetical protein